MSKMSEIKIFQFNPFQVNTYVVSDASRECVIIDPACQDGKEREMLSSFIDGHQLQPVYVLNTHAHVDHLPGVDYCIKKYGIPFLLHRDDNVLLEQAVNQGLMFGFDIEKPPVPDKFLSEGDILAYGLSALEVLHVPGHSPGSVVFKNSRENFLITGDVLFNGSIGRTDLPGGNYDALIKGIRNKLMILDDNYAVYPGHGPSSTIGMERKHNPFLI